MKSKKKKLKESTNRASDYITVETAKKVNKFVRSLGIEGITINDIEKVIQDDGEVIELQGTKTFRESLLSQPREDVIKVSKSSKLMLISNPTFETDVERFYEQFKHADGWYEKVNEIVFQSIPESDATLLFACVAIMSPRTEVGVNFDRAIALYVAIKKDIEINKSLIQRYIIETPKTFEQPEYQDLYIMKILKHMDKLSDGGAFAGFSTLANNLPRLLNFYLQNDQNINRDKMIEWIQGDLNLYGDNIAQIYGNVANTKSIRSLKVSNFLVNLLAPNYHSDEYYAVTLDKWMAKYLFDDGFNIGSDTGLSHVLTYLFASQDLRNRAMRMGISPPKLQETMWKGIMKTPRYQTNMKRVYRDLDYADSIHRMANEARQDNQRLDMAINEVRSAIDYMTEKINSLDSYIRTEVDPDQSFLSQEEESPF